MGELVDEYIVLSAKSLFDLEIAVKHHLKYRWIPQGGAFISHPYNSDYCQAMIKYQCQHHSALINDVWVCLKCGVNI